jgi:hypothetical protein
VSNVVKVLGQNIGFADSIHYSRDGRMVVEGFTPSELYLRKITGAKLSFNFVDGTYQEYRLLQVEAVGTGSILELLS